MLLQHAVATVFELSESVGVLDTDVNAVAKEKLTACFTHRRNTEYDIFVFRQTQQLPDGGETLDQFHARLQQLSENCKFANKDGEIRSQIIQTCAMTKSWIRALAKLSTQRRTLFPGCWKSPHNRNKCAAWGRNCYTCDKRNHFANVCRSTTANTILVAKAEQPLVELTTRTKARRTYSRLHLFTTRLNCREPIGSRQFSVHCAD